MRKFSDLIPEYKIEEINTSEYTTHKEGYIISKRQVMNLFQQVSNDAANGKYYVGITCDPERRAAEHNVDDLLVTIECKSVDKANELEKEADKYGFDAGDHVGNAHCKKSNMVYIYKKTSKTIE